MIIGLSGKIGVGKSQIGRYLKEFLHQYTIKSFAQGIKEECSSRFNYPLDWNYSVEGKDKEVKFFNLQTKENCKWKVRQVLQWYGTDYIRKNFDDYYWVNKLFNNLTTPNVIIDDVRHRIEAEEIKRRNGILVRIFPYEGWKEGEFSKHDSEVELDSYKNFDLLIRPQKGDKHLRFSANQIIDIFNLKRKK